MAYQGLPKKAPGDAPAAPTKTPAPTAEMGRSAATGYGRGDYPGKAYLDPGEKRTNDYLNPSDPVRDTVIARGLKADDASPIASQLRDLSKDGVNVGDAHGMASARARQSSSHSASAAKVPLRIGEPVPRKELP